MPCVLADMHVSGRNFVGQMCQGRFAEWEKGVDNH